jgi:hypothetical protein
MMSEATPPAGDANGDPDDTGLFGKLPRSRPGMRSPRRAGGGEVRTAAAKTEAKPKPKPARPATPPRVRAEEADARESDPEERGAGLEELAWAGIAVTAEAATLGVRLMSRALDAARRAAERG